MFYFVIFNWTNRYLLETEGHSWNTGSRSPSDCPSGYFYIKAILTAMSSHLPWLPSVPNPSSNKTRPLLRSRACSLLAVMSQSPKKTLSLCRLPGYRHNFLYFPFKPISAHGSSVNIWCAPTSWHHSRGCARPKELQTIAAISEPLQNNNLLSCFPLPCECIQLGALCTAALTTRGG